MTVLASMQSEDSDTYCLANRFAAKGLDDFENWEDISVASKKFGLPKDFEGGAKKHDWIPLPFKRGWEKSEVAENE